MSKFKGHTLDKVQASVLDRVIEYMEYLHEIEEEGGEMQDTLDSFVQETEEFLYELGAIKKTMFCSKEGTECQK
ncbi:MULTISPECIES: hypothetical protein [Bacillus]|uniref:hypothetical protein n=1 Tax=Bacillus TaxID=1386 RepID=UPI00119CFC7A|nr:hypothetical protein [Bacillus subtilis]MBT2169091.1 hypothetical protein [Bacillus subtilis]MCZ8480233.1 hypothetical protein [Bacillus subtilis]MDQ1878362.1 hypothetical protein [Bacillus subtilis]MED4559895.1 hypothetical protein [Bacillus subtilis]NDK02619.1 hypothetical protein [Bacillus subtilis subsp. subtilis]